MRKVLRATEGHILTNGKVYGRTIYLAEGMDESAFYEITEKEYRICRDNHLKEAE